MIIIDKFRLEHSATTKLAACHTEHKHLDLHSGIVL